MSRADVHRVADMLMATEEIASIVLRGRSEFEGDVVLRRAVERCLEIMGEAAKAVRSSSPRCTRRCRGRTWRRCEIDSAITTIASIQLSCGRWHR